MDIIKILSMQRKLPRLVENLPSDQHAAGAIDFAARATDCPHPCGLRMVKFPIDANLRLHRHCRAHPRTRLAARLSRATYQNVLVRVDYARQLQRSCGRTAQVRPLPRRRHRRSGQKRTARRPAILFVADRYQGRAVGLKGLRSQFVPGFSDPQAKYRSPKAWACAADDYPIAYFVGFKVREIRAGAIFVSREQGAVNVISLKDLDPDLDKHTSVKVFRSGSVLCQDIGAGCINTIFYGRW